MKRHKNCTCIANDVAGDEICKHCEIIWPKRKEEPETYEYESSYVVLQKQWRDSGDAD